MALDKLVDSTYLDTKLTSIANATREKTGKTDTLSIDDMVEEIENISIGPEIDIKTRADCTLITGSFSTTNNYLKSWGTEFSYALEVNADNQDIFVAFRNPYSSTISYYVGLIDSFALNGLVKSVVEITCNNGGYGGVKLKGSGKYLLITVPSKTISPTYISNLKVAVI